MSATANPQLGDQGLFRTTSEPRSVKFYWSFRPRLYVNLESIEAETRAIEADEDLHSRVVQRLHSPGESIPWEEALRTRLQVG